MRVVFMGSPEFAVPCLRALCERHEVVLVVSQPDKPAGRGGQLAAPAVASAAKQLGIPVIQPRSARTGELRDALVASGAELAVVVAYGKILPKAVLDALPRGCINVHASLLPAYRGAAPVQWAVIRGETETGVSIMQLDEGMDTGPVLLERRVAIDPAETSGELLGRLAPIGAQALLEAIDAIEAGTARPVAQDHARATHAPMLAKADGAIDFAGPAAAVAARIRGVDPWPGAQAMLRGQPVKLFRARVATGQGAPGAVSVIDAGQGAPGAVSAIDAVGQGAPGTVPAIDAGQGAPGTVPAIHAAGQGAPGAVSAIDAVGQGAPGAVSAIDAVGQGAPGTVPAIDAAGQGAPGTVLAIDAAGAKVACGDGAVVIAEIQAPGRKRLALSQFASGRGIAVGDLLVRPEPS